MKKITAADRERLKELTRKAWARILGRALGGDALSLVERAELGDIDAEVPVVSQAAMEGTGIIAGHPGAGIEEEYARRHALEHAGDRLRAVADRAADAYLEALEVEAVREKTAAAASANETPKSLAAELRRVTGDTMRDWDRVAVSELQDAHNEARARAIVEHHGEEDPEVFKQPAPDACFISGTLIRTKRGSIPIETIRKGDFVLTHRLRWRRVKGTLSRKYHGVLYGLNSLPYMTSNHPVLVDLDWRRADAAQHGDYIIKLRDVSYPKNNPSTISEPLLFAKIPISPMPSCMPVASIQLYGYLQMRNGDVDVPYVSSEFWNGRKVLEMLSEQKAFSSGTRQCSLTGLGLRSLHARGTRQITSDSGIFGQLFALFRGQPSHTFAHSRTMRGSSALTDFLDWLSQFMKSSSHGSWSCPKNAGDMLASSAGLPVLGDEAGKIEQFLLSNHIEPYSTEVSCIATSHFEGTVYNLEVDEDNSYFANDLAVHNCSWCKRLHIGPDGNPRIFKLSTLIAHGDNTGRSKPEWEAVVGITHPYCQCELFYIASGWGFDEDGELVPGGMGGIRYSSEEELIKAIAAEDAIQKAALLGGDIEISGIPIHIEANVGDARLWRGGKTILRHAYGEIPGTRGVDGEPVDVYVGPDPTADFAFAVDQRRPDGTLDEQKLFLGFRSPNEVETSYKFHYPEEFWGGVTQLSIPELWDKLVESDPDGMLKAGEDYRFRRDRQGPREDRGWVSNAPAMHNANETKWHAQPPTSAVVTVAENLARQKSTRPRLLSILPYNRPEALRPGASVRKLQLQSERTHMEPEEMAGQIEANARQLDERISTRRKNSQPDVNLARDDQKFPSGPSPTDG